MDDPWKGCVSVLDLCRKTVESHFASLEKSIRDLIQHVCLVEVVSVYAVQLVDSSISLLDRLKVHFLPKSFVSEVDEAFSVLRNTFIEARNLANTGEGNVQNVVAQLEGLLTYTLPSINYNFRLWLESQFDSKFRNTVGQRFSAMLLEDAMRQIFVVWKERLIEMFQVEDKRLDGFRLISHIFGDSGLLSRMGGEIDKHDRLSLLNMQRSLYSMFRNPYAHNRNAEPEWIELDACVSMVNYVLQKAKHYALHLQAYNQNSSGSKSNKPPQSHATCPPTAEAVAPDQVPHFRSPGTPSSRLAHASAPATGRNRSVDLPRPGAVRASEPAPAPHYPFDERPERPLSEASEQFFFAEDMAMEEC